ncbi:uncharacterized protein LOC62_03G003894 [Vanrija pseudolonga]|uniref:F-box domain-containing protein n=1 Tax=Vanrija pseudolonga TaxID=143232 RepID=A0AAF0Y576_9TREE|nr:hypothetical protein LOC62_03G003894 [Vanrija pseudolonga]
MSSAIPIHPAAPPTPPWDGLAAAHTTTNGLCMPLGGASTGGAAGAVWDDDEAWDSDVSMDAGPSMSSQDDVDMALAASTSTDTIATSTPPPPILDPWSGFPLINDSILSLLPRRDLLSMRRVSRNFCFLTNRLLTAHLVISADNRDSDTVVSGYTGHPIGLGGCRLLDVHRPTEDMEPYLFRISQQERTIAMVTGGWVDDDPEDVKDRILRYKLRTTYPFEQMDHVDMQPYQAHLIKVIVLRMVIDASYPVFTVPRHVNSPERLIIFTPTAYMDDACTPSTEFPTIIPPVGVSRLTVNIRYFVEKAWPRRPVFKDPIFFPTSLRELVIIFSPLDFPLSATRQPVTTSTEHERLMEPIRRFMDVNDPHGGQFQPGPRFIISLLAAVVRHNLTKDTRIKCTVVGIDWANDALWENVPRDVLGWMVDAIVAEVKREDARLPYREEVTARDIWGPNAGTPHQSGMLEVYRAHQDMVTQLSIHQHMGRFFRDLDGNIPERFRSPSPPPRPPLLDVEEIKAETNKLIFSSRRVYRASIGWEAYDLETKVDLSAVPE